MKTKFVFCNKRRAFIKKLAVAAATFSIVPRHVLGGRFVPPSEKLNVALIGAGSNGMGNVRALMELDDVQVMAIADPADTYRSARHSRGRGGRGAARQEIEKHYAEKTPNYQCAVYEDFRTLLEKEKAVDAIVCSTPDHLHAYVSIQAMRMKKHVYCEKPMGHNIREVREMIRVARETGCATQMGNRGHSSPGIRQTIEYLRDGAIGQVREIHVWVPTGRWNAELTQAPEEKVNLPAGLNWDLWLGPREARNYHPAYHPVSWRDFWDFGCGALGDFACHDLNAPVWAFNLPIPTSIEAAPIGGTHPTLVPHGSMVYFDFPARGKEPPIRLSWYDGGLRPPTPEALGTFGLTRRGALFIGEHGVINTDASGAAPRLFPAALRSRYQRPPEILPRSNGHYRDWVDACKGGPPAGSNFDYAGHLTEIVLLGVLALRTGKRIVWDAATMEAKGVPEAAPFIRESYRPGWELG